MTDQITPQPGDTAADLKMKIEKMQAERSESKAHTGKPLDDGKTPEPSSSNPGSKPNKSAASVAPQAHTTPEPGRSTQGEKTASSNKSVDLHEWAKSKGIDWKNETSILDALRRSDQEFHKRRQDQLKSAPVAPEPTVSFAQNGNGYSPAQPAYTPPPPPLPRHALENIARQYNMATEDAERLIAFNNDFMEAKLNTERQRLAKEFDELKRSNTKNDIFRELSSDPAFRNPQVLHEYHRTLEEIQEHDPKSFDEDPGVYRRAYDQVLINIARRNLQADVSWSQNQGNSFFPPSNPPRPIGGGGTGAMQKENELSQETFAKLPLEEQRMLLSRMGLISAKY